MSVLRAVEACIMYGGPPWGHVTRDVVKVESVSGGVSNLLYHVHSKDYVPEENEVLVRFYGTATSMCVDRVQETALMRKLAVLDLCPEVLYDCEAYRIERWLSGWRPLNPGEMADPAVSSMIASEMARLHSVSVDTSSVSIWSLLSKWLSILRHSCADVMRKFTFTVDQLEEDVALLKQIISKGQGPMFRPCLVHNDLLAGNMLNKGDRVRFIDYEYAAVDYAGYYYTKSTTVFFKVLTWPIIFAPLLKVY